MTSFSLKRSLMGFMRPLQKSSLFVAVIALLLCTISCKNYVIPIESFKNQMENTNSSNSEIVTVNNPLANGTITYSANNIDQIIVKDKEGNTKILANSPSIEMRVTHKNGKRFHMYFDTVILENDTLKGGRSRFVQSLRRELPLDSIVKIEVQDGGKKFKYQTQ